MNIMNSIKFHGSQPLFTSVLFEKLYARLQVQKENGVKVFGRFVGWYGIPTAYGRWCSCASYVILMTSYLV